MDRAVWLDRYEVVEVCWSVALKEFVVYLEKNLLLIFNVKIYYIFI